MNNLITSVFEFWDAWATGLCYAILGASSLLRLNHLPKSWAWRGLFERVALLFIFLGGLAGFISPVLGIFNRPALYELLSLMAMAVFSVSLTAPLWRELIPGMDRRGPGRDERSAILQAAVADGDEVCSH